MPSERSQNDWADRSVGCRTNGSFAPAPALLDARPVDRSEGVFERHSPLRRWLPMMLTLAAGLAVCFWVYQSERAAENDAIAAAFQMDAAERVAAIRRQVDVNFTVVQSIEAFFSASMHVEEWEFNQFVTPLLSRHAGVRAVYWAPRITLGQRETFEEEAEAAGLGDGGRFFITQGDGPQVFRPATDRPVYYPIRYAQPQGSQSTLVGFDLGSELRRRTALTRAAATGAMSMTRRVSLMQDPSDMPGLLVFHPVYTAGRPLETEPQRLEALQGFAVAAFRLEVAVQRAVSFLRSEPIQISVSDQRSEPSQSEVLYASTASGTGSRVVEAAPTAVDALAVAGGPLTSQAILNLGGRPWRVVCSATPAYVAARRSWRPLGLMTATLPFTALLLTFLWMAGDREKRIEELIAKRTSQLAAVNDQLRREIDERQLAERELHDTRTMLQLARQIQQSLLPAKPPALEQFDIAGASTPAESVGGDHFDFVPMSEGRLGIVIGDASGHGVGPALVMAEARACLRTLARTYGHVGEILTHANRILVEGMPEQMFITLTLACFDPGNRSLVYANAGHPAGCVLDSRGEMRAALPSLNLPLGIDPQGVYAGSDHLRIEPGDLLYFVTDGILEAADDLGEQFGATRVMAVVQANLHQPAARIVQSLYEAVTQHCDGKLPTDDMTVVVIKALNSN